MSLIGLLLTLIIVLLIFWAVRALMGAFAIGEPISTVVYVLLQSGLIPLDVPDGPAGTNFVIALAILAGFSERWARGVLAGTEERIQGAGAGKKP